MRETQLSKRKTIAVKSKPGEKFQEIPKLELPCRTCRTGAWLAGMSGTDSLDPAEPCRRSAMQCKRQGHATLPDPRSPYVQDVRDVPPKPPKPPRMRRPRGS